MEDDTVSMSTKTTTAILPPLPPSSASLTEASVTDATEEKQIDINDLVDEGNLSYEEWNGVDVMTSLCMRCGENGITRLMLHKIPYFRELIIASFHCEECGERNNEVTFGGEIQILGCKYELSVTNSRDLDRQVIKSDSGSVYIPEIDFEIPPHTQKGEISTIEGFLMQAVKNLGMYQSERMEQIPEVGEKVAEIMASLTRMAQGSYIPFKFIVTDPAGNSYVENTSAPAIDPNMKISNFKRTAEMDLSLGLQPDKGTFIDDKDRNFKVLMEGGFGTGSSTIDSSSSSSSSNSSSSSSDSNIYSNKNINEDGDSVRLGRSEIIRIPSACPNCYADGECLTAVTDIPHFKEVIIMAFDCISCGFRNNEVKGGGAVPTYGTEVTLQIESLEDLKRDVLKSDSALVMIPEIELEVQSGTLGGVYTTIEGLLNKIHANLYDGNPFAIGDSIREHHSVDTELKSKKKVFEVFMDRLKDMANGRELGFTIVLKDPLGNSFISAQIGSFLPPEMDKNLTMADYVRTFEENEDIGLNDMNTADYETGFEYEVDGEIRQPDRLTHVIPKGQDHPTFFAKGTDDDTTPGGMYISCTNGNDVDDTINNDESSKREFDAIDNSIEFDPREEFGGYRENFVFRLGGQGLGYYRDVKIATSLTNSISNDADSNSNSNSN